MLRDGWTLSWCRRGPDWVGVQCDSHPRLGTAGLPRVCLCRQPGQGRAAICWGFWAVRTQDAPSVFHPHDHSNPVFPQRSNTPSYEMGLLAWGEGQRPVPGRDGGDTFAPHPHRHPACRPGTSSVWSCGAERAVETSRLTPHPPTAGASIPVPSTSLPEVSVISKWLASSN